MECQHNFNISTKHVRSCECGNVKGMYVDDLNAVFTAKTDRYVLIGFANYTLQKAVSDYFKYGSEDGWGLNFTSFVIPEPCKTFERVNENCFEKTVKKLFTKT